MRIRVTIRTLPPKLLLAFFVVSLLLVSGCSSAYERSKKPAGDWSRGLLLGEGNIRQDVALDVDAQRRVHLAWIERPSDQSEEERLHYVRLNQQGQVETDRTLSLDLPRPRSPKFFVDEGNQLHLALLSRTDGLQELYHVRIDAEGQPTEPIRLSREGENVNSFQTYVSADGERAFIWESEPVVGQAGIYRVVYQEGETASPTLIIPDGIEPSVLADRGSAGDPGSAGDDTTTHLTWLTRTGPSVRAVYYATLQNGAVTPPEGQQITSFQYAESATYRAPVIGLDNERVYLMWSVQNLGGGLTPTAADTYYVSFPLGEPRRLDQSTVKLPSEHRPGYDDHASPYQYTELAPLSSDIYSTDFINAPAVAQRREEELPIVVSVIIESASKQFMQLAMTVFADGEPVGYQLANETSNASVLPTLVADPDANLHLAWLDTAGFRTYKVYYATTAPEAREWLDRTTVEDVGRSAADLLWGVLSAIGFLPLTVMWNAPALVWLVLFYVFTRQEYLDELGAKIGLGVAFVVYIVVKMLFLPGLLSGGTPFVYIVPEAVAPVMSTFIPISILVLALIGLVVYVRRSKGEAPSLLKAYLVFALIDSGLTAILYAPRFFDPRG
jgi:hypothetical protein